LLSVSQLETKVKLSDLGEVFASIVQRDTTNSAVNFFLTKKKNLFYFHLKSIFITYF